MRIFIGSNSESVIVELYSYRISICLYCLFENVNSIV